MPANHRCPVNSFRPDLPATQPAQPGDTQRCGRLAQHATPELQRGSDQKRAGIEGETGTLPGWPAATAIRPTNATFSLRRPNRICGAARNSACV